MKIRALKTRARFLLRGHYTRLSIFILTHFVLGLIATLIPSAAFSDMSSVPLLIGAEALAYLITVLVNMTDIGLTKATLNVCRYEEYTFGDLIYAYKNSRDAFLKIEMLLTAIQTAFNIPLLFLPQLTENLQLNTYVYYLIYLGWVFLSTFLSMLVSLRLRFSILVLLDHPDMTAGAALLESLRLTRGRFGYLLKLQLAFLGEYLLAIASLYIGFLLVNSYIRTANAVYYDEILLREPPKIDTGF